MNFPNLPTDNLYKFLSIAGIVLILFAIYIIIFKGIEIDSNTIELNGEISKLNIASNQLKLEKKILKDAILEFYTIANINEEPTINDTIIIYTRLLDGPKDLVENSKHVSDLVYKFNAKSNEYREKQITIDTKKALLKYSENNYNFFVFSTLVIVIVGFTLTSVGFQFWYNKVQKYHDKILFTDYMNSLGDERVCQSCGIMISDDLLKGGTEKDGTINKTYCSNCYQNGIFTDPTLTFGAMKSKIESQMKKLKFSKKNIKKHLSSLKYYKRWQNNFKW